MKLYTSRTYQQWNNSRYPYPVDVATAEDLLAVVAWDHVAAQYQDNHRATDNFICADCIMMDVDNATGKGQPDIPPEKWRDLDAIRADLPGVAFYAVTSRNHMKEKDGRPPRPKYHLYFEIPRTTSAEEYRSIKLAITARLTYFDTNAADAARMFYGNKAASVWFYPGERLITDWIKTTPVPDQPPQARAPVELNQQRPQRTGKDNGLYDFNELLQYIPCAQLDMKAWIKIGMALKATGYDVSTWDAWSATDPDRYHPGECARRWRSFGHSKGNTVGGTHIIEMAKSYGWQRPERKKKEGQRMSIETPTKELQQEEVQQEPAAPAPSYIDLLLQDFQTKRYEPIPTGIPAFDTVINAGFIRQTLVNLSAEPGAGKTMLTQQVMEEIAAQGRADILYFNLEMSRAQLLARSLSRLTGYSATTIMRGYQWNNTQREAITAAAATYRDTVARHMVYEDMNTSNYQAILQRMEEGYNRRKDTNLPFICVIDYLQLLGSAEKEDAVEIIKHSMKQFKDFATRTGSVIFMIMAQSRAVNESGAVTMGAGRDSSATEYSADLQLQLTYAKIADGTYTSKAQMRKALKENKITKEAFTDIALVCTKNRFGPPDTVCGMKMEPKRSRFVFDEPTDERAPAQRRKLY